MFAKGKKMTSDMGQHIRYTAGQQVACLFFHETSQMFTDAFNKVNWPNVYRTLNKEVPRLFQVWACKQVMNISATNKNLSLHHQDGHSDKSHVAQSMRRQGSTSFYAQWLAGWRHLGRHPKH
jgi:hypothetical protein